MKLQISPTLSTLLIAPLLCGTLVNASISSVTPDQVGITAPSSQVENSATRDTLKKNIGTEYLQLARDYEKENNAPKAVQFYKKALEFLPDDLEASFSYANFLYNQNNIEQAIEQYKKSLNLKTDSPSLHYNLGVCLEKKDQKDEAISHFKEALRLNPGYTNAYLRVGNLLKNQKKQEEALSFFERGLQTTPHALDLLNAAAGLLKDLNRFEEAINYYRSACEQNPQNLSCLLELGNTYNMINCWPEALECYKKILEIRPNTHEVLYNFGYTLKKMGYVQESIEVYDKVLKMSPEYPQARFSRSLAYLSLGDFNRGWPEYEWRWQAYNESPKKYPQPVWDGSNPAGKTILVYAEQGLGDTFQFIRYAKCIKDQGGHVIAEVQKPLKKLLSLCPYLDAVFTPQETKPHFDAHIALMSLPMAYKTEVNTIPTEIPYLFARPDLVELWRNKLAEDKNFKIGLCWQGNPLYRSQFLRQAVAGKSMHVKTLLPLGKIKGITLYSLQKISGTDQLEELGDKLIIHTIPGLDEENGPFMDTAAIMKNIDLMITIDTSMAHIAGGLGIPVWCLLPEPADWRWMLKRLDTPWFPKNMRLFRQPTPGDWDSVIQQVACELEKLVPQWNTQKARIETATPETTYTKIATKELIASCATTALATQQSALVREPIQTRPMLKPFIPTPFDVHSEPAVQAKTTEQTRTVKTTCNQTCPTNAAVTETVTNDPAVFQYCDPIAEFVDKLTMLSVQAENGALSPQENTEYEQLQKRYATYQKEAPSLDALKDQLLLANKQSFLLNKKSSSLQELKKYLKKKIADLGIPHLTHS